MTATDYLTTIDDVIENYASNNFQLRTSFVAVLPGLIATAFLNISAVISPYLKCEWDMTDFQVALASSILYIGEVVGSFYWGKTGDAIGRKFPLILVSCCTIYFSLLSSMSPTLCLFMFTRFFVGKGIAAIYVLSMVHGLEFVKCSRRGMFTALALVFMSSGLTFSNLVAYLTLNRYGWRLYTVCIAVPLIFILPLLTFLPESIRYLEVCGRATEILDIVKDMIKDNKTASMPNTIHLKSQKRDRDKKGSLAHIFYKYTKTVVALSAIWVCIPLTNYGLFFLIVYELQTFQQKVDRTNCSFLTQENLVDVLWIGLSQFPFIFVCYGIMEKFGRKPLMCFSLLSFLTTYVLMLLSLPHLVIKTLLFCGLGMSNSVFIFFYQYTLELFPTYIRTTSVGFCATVGKLASILTPFIFQYMIYWSFTSVMVLMSMLTIMSLIALCFLEETKGVHLS